MKTSREYVLETIGHKRPEMLPATLYLDNSLRQKIKDGFGSQAISQFENDTVRILWDIERDKIGEKTFYDPFGVRWICSNGAYFFKDPPLKEPDVSKIPMISLLPEKESERILKICKENPGKFIYYQFTMTFGERLWALRGMEQYLTDLVLNQTFIHKALDLLLEMHLEALDTLIKLPIDGITFGDDFGSQKGLMISPDAFRLFFKNRLSLMYDKVRNAGLVVGAHSCGDNTPIIRDYVDIGLQVFHPLQPECMDITVIKREFGKELAFRGGIGVQRSVGHGTPDQVTKEVFNAAKVLSVDGGYIMEPCKPLPPETSVENVLAFIEAMQKAKHYQFD